MLTKKYGEPEVCIEEFQTKIMQNDDNSKIHEVRMNRCKYVTGYTTEKGDIELQIKGSFTDGCYVTLIYFDKINGEVIEKNYHFIVCIYLWCDIMLKSINSYR